MLVVNYLKQSANTSISSTVCISNYFPFLLPSPYCFRHNTNQITTSFYMKITHFPRDGLIKIDLSKKDIQLVKIDRINPNLE